MDSAFYQAFSGLSDVRVDFCIYNADTNRLVTSGNTDEGYRITTDDWVASYEDDEEPQDKGFVAVEELLEKCNIPADKYPVEDIQNFIIECELTSDLIDKLNIDLLLEDYCRIQNKNSVEDIFDQDKPKRTDNFTEDVAAIAFYVNRNTNIKCVYYDFEEGLVYHSEEGYIFDDLDAVEAEPVGDEGLLLEMLNIVGVFNWESVESASDDITDPQSMCFAVAYKDGSSFCVSASGIISEILPNPDIYDDVEFMLFNYSEMTGNLSRMDEAAIVDICELTDNNFIEGVNRTLSDEEIDVLKDACSDVTLSKTNSKSERKYVVYVYDENEDSLYDIYIAEDGKIYVDDGTDDRFEVTGNALEEWFEKTF